MHFLFAIFALLFFTTSERDTPISQDKDSVVVERLQTKFDSLIHRNPKAAKYYVDSLELFSGSKNYPRAQFLYRFDLGYYYFISHKIESSISNFKEARRIAIELHLSKEAVNSNIWLANHEYFKQNTFEARKLYNTVLKESQEVNYIDGIANAYYGLSKLEKEEEMIIGLLLKIDSIYNREEKVSPILANTLSDIGKMHWKSNNRKTAKTYFSKAMEIAYRANYIPGIKNIPELLGKMALEEQKYEEAYSYFETVLNESNKISDSINAAHAQIILAEVDMETGGINLAEQRILSALSYYEIFKDSISLSNTHLMLAKLYLKKKDPAKVKYYLDLATEFAKSENPKQYRIHALELTIEYLEQIRDYQQAYVKQKELESLKAATLNKKNGEAFLEMERAFEARKKEQEIILLKSQKQLAEQKSANQRNLLMAAIGLTTTIGLLFFFLYKNRQKTARKLREVDQMKSDFFANISHEFRTPLTLISGPLQHRLENKELNRADQSDFEMMQRNSDRLLNLVDQMLDLSKLESGSYKLRMQKGSLGTLINSLSESFHFLASQKKIKYTVSVEELKAVCFDKNVIEKILINLLSNAFKYTPESGSIYLNATQEGDFLKLAIQNSGSSLTQEKLTKLFGRFYQADPQSEGVGLGLALVKELVELSQGTIKVEKTSNDILSFVVKLPLIESYFDKHDLIVTNTQIESAKTQHFQDLNGELETAIYEESISEEQEILLIIEDNADVRKFVKNCFSQNFKVVEAENGSQGMKLAFKIIPDIIISDILMPGIDGLKLCNTIKSDERTSHIPVILLTAKATEEDQFLGLEMGADDYVTKPFTTKLLKQRVQNLITSRKKLRERYGHEVILRPKEITITNLDERFLERLQTVLDEHLTESTFSVQELSQQIGMSRMQLHRKLKALTGLSASEFIRSQRLKLAANLLQKSDASISEIGYQVGFNDPSYFTKCFKEVYGCSPTAYLSS